MPEIPEATQQKAAAIQDRFNQSVTTIRSDANLSTQGRTQQLAAAFIKADTEMTALRDSWGGVSVETAENLTRKVFGARNVSGADAISAREAFDRVSKIVDADESFRLLHWADNNGDEVLARAVAQHAFERRDEFFGGDWAGVVGAYAQTHPEVADQIIEIAQARREGVMTGLSAAFTFSLHKPQELERYGAAALAVLAQTGSVA